MYHFRVPCSSCVVIVIVNGNQSLGSERNCPGSKGQQGLCTTNSHGTQFQSHGDAATDPCHGHLCHEALDTFGHLTSATLTFDVQPEEHFTSPASRNTQFWTQWRWRGHTRERSHQRAKTCPVERSHQRSTCRWEHRHCVFIGKGPNWQ